MRATRALVLVLLFGARLDASGTRDEERPFPVERTTILREEKVVYTVEGTVTIPAGVEVTCLRDVYIQGRGDDAVIRVEGSLKVHGVGAREVIFEDVAIELAETFLDVQIDMAIFRSGSGIRTPPGGSSDGKLFLELTDFKDSSKLDVTLRGGSVDLSSVCSDAPARIAAVTPEGAEENKVKVKVRGCTQASDHPGLVGGLILENAYDATVRINRMAGPLSAFRNCRSLIFDGNKVNSTVLEFVQGEGWNFHRTKITKCDVYSEKVTARSAATEEKPRDPVLMDRCWFRGIEDPRQVREQVLQDGEGEEENAAEIRLGKIGSRPLELAGSWDR